MHIVYCVCKVISLFHNVCIVILAVKLYFNTKHKMVIFFYILFFAEGNYMKNNYKYMVIVKFLNVYFLSGKHSLKLTYRKYTRNSLGA